MGEANPEAITRIKELTGHKPRLGATSDGQQCLRIGDIELVATGFALWSDPSVYDHEDGMISILWGGQTARLYRQPDGSWKAECHPNLLAGKARWVP